MKITKVNNQTQICAFEHGTVEQQGTEFVVVGILYHNS